MTYTKRLRNYRKMIECQITEVQIENDKFI